VPNSKARRHRLRSPIRCRWSAEGASGLGADGSGLVQSKPCGAEGLYTFWSRTVGSYRVASLVAFIICFTLCACTVLLLTIWAEPFMDDFCRASFGTWRIEPHPAGLGELLLSRHFHQDVSGGAAFGQKHGIIEYTKWIYLNWSGRWAGMGLETLLLSTTTLPGAYPWLVFTLIMIQFIFLYLAIWNFVEDARLAAFLGAVTASVYWATMPDRQTSLFWLTGDIENQLPLTLGLLLFSLALSCHPTATRQTNRLRVIAASGLGFVTPAFHELAGGVLFFALSAITARAFLSKSSDRKMWLSVWAASAIGFLVVFVAPGNFVRMAVENPHRNSSLVVSGLLHTIHHQILPWGLDFKHWLLAIVLWFDPGVASVRAKFLGMSSFRAISGFVLVWISSIMIAVVTAIWGQSKIEIDGRTLDFIYGVYLSGWIALAFLLIRPHPRFSVHPAHRVTTLSLALFLLSALVATSDNTVKSISEIISGGARSWSAELNMRFAILKAAGRDADVMLPPLSTDPKNLAWNDIKEDPKWGWNECLSLLFGVHSVRISIK
jgi:hypothetical protein